FSNKEELGTRIFKIDEEGFLSTTFFSQRDMEVKSNTSLTNKFNESCDVKDSLLFDKAVAKIKEKASKYSYSGNRGIIPETKTKLFEINNKIDISKSALLNENALKEEAQKLVNDIDNDKKELEDLRKSFAVAGRAEAISIKKQRIEKLNSDRQEETEKINSANAILNGNKITEEQASSLNKCIADLSNTKSKIEIAKSDINSIKAQEKTVEKSHVKNTNISFILFALVFAVLGVVMLFLSGTASKIFSGFLFCFAVVFAVMFFFKGNKKSNENNAISELIKTKQSELQGYLDVEKTYVENIEKFLSNFNASGSYSEKLNSIILSQNIISESKKKIAEIDKEKESLAIDKDVSLSDFSLNAVEIKKKIETVENELNRKSGILSNVKTRISACEVEANSLLEYESIKTELTEKLENSNKDLEILKCTLDFLKEADENLKVNYRAPLEESLNKYLNLITGNKIEAKIDVDLKVSISDNGSDRQADYFSKGYQNLFEICKRFALIDVLFTEEKPFIILDDPFYNLDDEKLKLALDLLKKLQGSYQIMYFVCHESRVV
ncbi:MAG: hypothetical protein MJ066_04470, partial [Clostridia bacterium]|nr:hypothetical protein [Clostridia bacterium]